MASPTLPIRLRVMVFNVEEGAAGVDFDQTVAAIRLADPDVVALQEAMGNAARIATALGWEFASARTQVIARFPILDPVDLEPGLVFVEVGPEGAVAIWSVHPPAEPYGPDLVERGRVAADIDAMERRIRLPKVERALALSPGLSAAGMPVFLLGDFNAPSHLDWTDAAVGLRPHMRLAMDWPVSRAIEVAGFRDTWREIHPDPVAEPGLTWWADRPPTGGYEPGPDTPNDRIDYVYAMGPSETTDCQIVGEAGRLDVAIGLDPWPSDHRAVVATFDLVPGALPDVAGPAWPGSPSGFGDHPDVEIRTSRASYGVGEPIEVSWANGPGYRWDWIAVFRVGASDLADAHLLWRHTWTRAAGTLTLDGDAAIVDPSSIGGVWPLPPGDYAAAYLLDDAPIAAARTRFRVRPGP